MRLRGPGHRRWRFGRNRKAGAWAGGTTGRRWHCKKQRSFVRTFWQAVAAERARWCSCPHQGRQVVDAGLRPRPLCPPPLQRRTREGRGDRTLAALGARPLGHGILGRSATFLPNQIALHLALRLELDLLLQLPLRGVPASALSLCRACLIMHGRCAVRAHRVKLLFPPPGLCTLPRTLHLFGARLRSRRAEGALEDLRPAGYV
mmetsp:Transcript_18999/g.53135  ORF Transcript_18999/g.53135 Transcript_18999/m.53135 type:complete len:204 (+) Transcript_18999:900-1511(+)